MAGREGMVLPRAACHVTGVPLRATVAVWSSLACTSQERAGPAERCGTRRGTVWGQASEPAALEALRERRAFFFGFASRLLSLPLLRLRLRRDCNGGGGRGGGEGGRGILLIPKFPNSAFLVLPEFEDFE